MALADESTAPRAALMRICAAATDAELHAALAAMDACPEATEIRPPEFGLAMLRGRMGGDGAPFNLGEATVTRAAVALSTGAIGVSYLLGRRPEAARAAARIDALGQSDAFRPVIEAALCDPVRRRLAAEREATRRETAATKVDFFTLVRGEDAAP